MNVAQLIKIAQVQADEHYEGDTWIFFINACLDDLTPVVKMLKRSIVQDVVVDNGELSIALTGGSANAELSKIHECLYVYFTPTEEISEGVATPIVGARMQQLNRLTLADRFSFGWLLTNDELSIVNIPRPSSGNMITKATITVYYYKKLNHVANLASVPELPEQYHNLIALFICAKSQQKEEELGDKQDFYAEYLLGKSNMARDRIWENEPQNRKFIRKARIIAATGASTDR